MSKSHFIRCDHWRLQANVQVVNSAQDTIKDYRKLVNALCTVFLTHWPSSNGANVQTLERLFHATAQSPTPVYGAWFHTHFNRFPSYLRRSATMAALGAVSSYMTRYRTWQGGARAKRDARPPIFGKFNGFPVLYSAQGGAGAMVRVEGDIAYIKLCTRGSAATQGGTAWSWHAVPIASRGKRHLNGNALLSPTLQLKGRTLSLTQPVEISRKSVKQQAAEYTQHLRDTNAFPHLNVLPQIEVVCAVDLGINTTATCSIIDANGTVIARKFISSRGIHMARQSRCVSTVQRCARKTMGGVELSSATSEKEAITTAGKLSKGFCRNTYRRAANLNTEIAREASRAIIDFTRAHGAMTIVFEDLKGFRPKGGEKTFPVAAEVSHLAASQARPASASVHGRERHGGGVCVSSGHE